MTTPPRSSESPAPLELLNEIARIATLDLDLRPMLQRITDALARQFGWEFVACASVDTERRRFVCEALTSSRPTSISVGYTRDLGSGVVGEVASTGRPILVDDVREHSNYVETMPGTLSELCVPVLHGGRMVAILNLESTGLASFHDQLPLLQTVAGQIAGAIASARRYTELTRRARLMEMMSEVSRSALEAVDLDSLLDRVVRYVNQHLDLSVVAILLLDPQGERFSLAAHAGAGKLAFEVGASWPVSNGVVGRCIRTGEVQFVPDVSADADYLPALSESRSELAVPIRFQGRVLGVLNAESTSPEVFDRETDLCLRLFASQIAGAIHLAAVNQRLKEANAQVEERTRELEKANRALSRLSTVDGLTGAWNRRRFDEALDSGWRDAQSAGRPISLIMVDVDFFKWFNDSYGHQRGDECLRLVSSALRDVATASDGVVYRYGGEEFAILLPSAGNDAAAAMAAELQCRVERLGIPHEPSPYRHVTISAGVSTIVPADGHPAHRLVELADAALYAAKRSGRNRAESALPGETGSSLDSST